MKATSSSPDFRPATVTHGVLAVQDQPEVRQVRGDQGPQGRQDADIGRGKGAHRHVAGAAFRGLPGKPPRMLDAAEDVPRLAQEDAPGIGQGHVMPAAIEQLRANGLFQLADLLAE